MLKNEVNYKALAFIAEQTASTFNYEVKGVRALWDPSLSIPGTNRRGGWRCPVGTRYGGQITDRFGRSCGWGVARRIANQIADIGERLENVDDRKRNERLAKRNARVQRFLARQDKPGLLERGARGIADVLDGGETGKPAIAPRAPARPRIPVQQQRPRIPVQPPARPQNPVRRPDEVELGRMLDENGRVIPRPRRRGNLRESERRRIERELVQPGAPRTGEPPKPNAPRRRRQNAAQQGAKRTARRKPEADFVDSSKPSPTKVPRRKPALPPKRPAEPSSPIPSPPPMAPTPPKPASIAPARPAGPPPIRRQLALDLVEFNKPEDRVLVRLTREDIEKLKPNVYNNLKDLDKDALKAKRDQLKREQALFDQDFETALREWADKKNLEGEERRPARNNLLRIHAKREKNFEGLKAIDTRIIEIDAGIEHRQRPPYQPSQPWPEPRPPERPVLPEPSVAVTEDVIPNDKIVPDADAGIRSPRKIGRQQILDDAIKELHENDGKLADIQDGIVIDAVVDGQFKDGNLPNGREYTDTQVADFVKNGFKDFNRGAKFENRRYKFELVKQSNGMTDVWCVLKVEDKNTGEKWFLKSSTYGANDGLLENVGMRAAQALEFGNDENHLRLGNIITNDVSGRRQAMPRRWIMMRDIGQWENGVQGEWNEAGRGLAAVADQINPRDVGRIAVLDMVLDNQDRHGANFMWVQAGNRVRLGLIDHGMLGGGRRQGDVDEIPGNIEEWADGVVANPGVRRYVGQFNNGIGGILEVGFRIRNQRDRRILRETMLRSVQKMKADLDLILGVDRIQANGLELSDLEKTHIKALKRVAEARISWIENNLDDMVDQFNP